MARWRGCARTALLLVVLAWGGPTRAAPDAPAGAVGIDVSHHSGAIDWERVAAQRFAFVYLKASEGVDAADPTFADHWRSARAADLARGAYHFFVTEDDPLEQARFFLSRLELAPGDLPPVVDVETLGRGTTGDLSAKLRAFVDEVERVAGVRAMIYTSARFWDAHFDGSFGEHPLWVAEYGVEAPELPRGWTTWTLWQYRETAATAGVEKGADLSRIHPEVELGTLGVPWRPPAGASTP